MKHDNRCLEPKTYWIETYGCQMNMAESNALEVQLQGVGLKPAESPEAADCAILNTCSVRKTAENRIWGRLGLFQYIKQQHPLTLVVTGCMAERLQEELKQEAPAVDYVVGTNDKQKIVELLLGTRFADGYQSEKYSFTNSYYKDGDYASYVPIMNGCNNFCSFCIVPYVRGREISRPVDDVLAEVRKLDAAQVREITLLGQNVNSYAFVQDGRTVRFPELLRLVCRDLDNIRWVRFESPHPKDFSEDLIEVIATEPRVAKHLHIPLQSGSSRILSLMNRRYTRERFLDLIDSIRRRIPDVTFATDVMVGFPGETEEEYEQTLEAMRIVKFIEAYMYYWNPREGTRAVDMEGQLPDEVKIRRLQDLIAMEHEIMAAEKAPRATGIVDVLVTQVSRNDADRMLGRTEHGEMVAFVPLGHRNPGDFVSVALNSLSGNTYNGEEVPSVR
ncbi:MAG: tRNA (N6-isopentenyl adenosine(37)-C2)-methylthiotransferase MiaB [Sphaerochaetaceae bacterium]|jgi:tRNA-2-methylthio-N6-dimethylallyladenosine synthase